MLAAGELMTCGMCFAFVSVHILGIHIHLWLFLSLLALPLLERASKTPRPEAKVSLPHIELLIRGQDLGSPSRDGQVQLGTEGGYCSFTLNKPQVQYCNCIKHSFWVCQSMIPGKPSKSVVDDASDHRRCDLRLPCRALCMSRQTISVDAIHDPSSPAKIASTLAH